VSEDPGAPADGSAQDDDAAAIEYGRWLFAQSCDFVAGATAESNLPAPELDEVAFAGRSNVGKSSLLNALTGRKSLARISHTPGRTQQINFFRLGDRLMLVDLPGYGYAKASKQRIKGWNRLIDRYLMGRPNLRRVCLLLDCRRGIGDVDRRVMDQLDTDAVTYQVVLTKADKSTAAELARQSETLAADLAARPACFPGLIATSARTGAGIEALRAGLAALAPAERFE